MKEENAENQKLKTNFLDKVKYSIFKIEKYPDMATEGVKRAIKYVAVLVSVLAIILCVGILYQAHKTLKDGIYYIQNEFPEFSYKDEILNVETDEDAIVTEGNSLIGKAIIDTKTENEQTINQYINSLTNSSEGIIILKSKVIVKKSGVAGTQEYSYKDVLKQFNIDEFTKQDVINYANSSKMISLYASVFFTVFIYAFILYLLITVVKALLLSFFGYITTLLARIKIRYTAIFNMSVYALTLPIILNILYVEVNIFTTFYMEYFQVMYVAVAAIYLVAAILILKTEFIKQQFELTKIAEAQAIVKKELEEQKQKEKEEQEREERKEKDKKEEEKEKNNQPDGAEEVEGSAEA